MTMRHLSEPARSRESAAGPVKARRTGSNRASRGLLIVNRRELARVCCRGYELTASRQTKSDTVTVFFIRSEKKKMAIQSFFSLARFF